MELTSQWRQQKKSMQFCWSTCLSIPSLNVIYSTGFGLYRSTRLHTRVRKTTRALVGVEAASDDHLMSSFWVVSGLKIKQKKHLLEFIVFCPYVFRFEVVHNCYTGVDGLYFYLVDGARYAYRYLPLNSKKDSKVKFLPIKWISNLVKDRNMTLRRVQINLNFKKTKIKKHIWTTRVGVQVKTEKQNGQSSFLDNSKLHRNCIPISAMLTCSLNSKFG